MHAQLFLGKDSTIAFKEVVRRRCSFKFGGYHRIRLYWESLPSKNGPLRVSNARILASKSYPSSCSSAAIKVDPYVGVSHCQVHKGCITIATQSCNPVSQLCSL